MDTFNLYNDIATRTAGDIYLGVVGPVRTGKSTFIKRFMEMLVLPKIANKNEQQRAIDELPQSADGKTIMTTQPKFVPAEAVSVRIGDNIDARIRLIDCVGYLIDGAVGSREGEKTRMVKTPWSADDMPFERAAEMGTEKVIRDHSTIGVLVTSDGTITDIDRPKYVEAEERVVRELKALGKPFVVLLNSRTPNNPDTIKLRDALAERYAVPVLVKNAQEMSLDDIAEIMKSILMEFPIKMLDAIIPEWLQALPINNKIIQYATTKLFEGTADIFKMSDADRITDIFTENEYFDKFAITSLDMGRGRVVLELNVKAELFYEVISEWCGAKIDGEFKLMAYVVSLAKAATEYAKLQKALTDVAIKGYGVVAPTMDQLILEEPEIVKQAGRFGVKLKASAPSLHIMRVDVQTEVNPIVGSEQQSEELVKYLLSEFESDKKSIWDTNMFGKSLSQLVNEGLNNKLLSVPEEAQVKMRKTMGRIINEGKGGMICILL
ncbi:MAG: stage IV sporulation protein A [Clostridia bacterium]|nr:stage IV sporulation protein A [Clostridia bacterium]